MEIYNWQHADWPHFSYSLSGLEEKLFEFAEKTGRLSGILESLPADVRQETLIELMIKEALKTSEIEGEYMSRADVLSSIRKNLGLHHVPMKIRDARAAGIAALMIDVRDTFREPLSSAKLFEWHRMLFSGRQNILIGAWRTHPEPMQVVSGALGKEKVHFEAPPSAEVPREMAHFLSRFNETCPNGSKRMHDAPIRSAIAHLHFESIHPFEDGNGRIGRAIAEKALSQGIGRPVLLSLSDAIESEKRAYYEALKTAQRSNEITPWIHYFTDTLLKAQLKAEKLIAFTLKKARFFDDFSEQLNERQKKVINRMFDEGPDGFEGGMNATKYRGITKASKATATRDLQQLLAMGIFEKIGDAGGRSTRYGLRV